MFTCLEPNPHFWCILTWSCHTCCLLPYGEFPGACLDMQSSCPIISRCWPDWICVFEQPVILKTLTKQKKSEQQWSFLGSTTILAIYKIQNPATWSLYVEASDIAKPTDLEGLGSSWCFCYRLGFSMSEVWSEKLPSGSWPRRRSKLGTLLALKMSLSMP